MTEGNVCQCIQCIDIRHDLRGRRYHGCCPLYDSGVYGDVWAIVAMLSQRLEVWRTLAAYHFSPSALLILSLYGAGTYQWSLTLQPDLAGGIALHIWRL